MTYPCTKRTLITRSGPNKPRCSGSRRANAWDDNRADLVTYRGPGMQTAGFIPVFVKGEATGTGSLQVAEI